MAARSRHPAARQKPRTGTCRTGKPGRHVASYGTHGGLLWEDGDIPLGVDGVYSGYARTNLPPLASIEAVPLEKRVAASEAQFGYGFTDERFRLCGMSRDTGICRSMRLNASLRKPALCTLGGATWGFNTLDEYARVSTSAALTNWAALSHEAGAADADPRLGRRSTPPKALPESAATARRQDQLAYRTPTAKNRRWLWATRRRAASYGAPARRGAPRAPSKPTGGTCP